MLQTCRQTSVGADELFSRTTPVALATMATSALNAPEMLATGAPVMASVRTELRGRASAVAMKVSMAPRVRTVSRDDTAPTAPQVRNNLELVETKPSMFEAGSTGAAPQTGFCCLRS